MSEELKVKLVNRILPKQGHSCFQYDVVENKLSYANFANTVDENGVKLKTKKVLISDNCLYVTALNFKNAVKHLQNILEKKIEPIIVK